MAEIDLRWNDLIDIGLRIKGNTDAELLFEALQQTDHAEKTSAEVGALEDELADLDQQIKDKDERIAELEAELAHSEAELDERDTRVAELESELASLQAEVDPLS